MGDMDAPVVLDLADGLDLDGNAPGSYVIVHNKPRGVAVYDGVEMDSNQITHLPQGHVVEVLEVLRLPVAKRIRARIKEPAGWISLKHTRSGYRWAVQEQEAWSPTPFRECTSGMSGVSSSLARTAGSNSGKKTLDRQAAQCPEGGCSMLWTCEGYDGYKCDRCGAVLAGFRWHCPIHSADVCPTCTPPKADEDTEDKKTLSPPPGKLGMRYERFTGEILNVSSGSVAEREGIETGWIMTHINGQPYSDELYKATLGQRRDIVFSVQQGRTVQKTLQAAQDRSLQAAPESHEVSASTAPDGGEWIDRWIEQLDESSGNQLELSRWRGLLAPLALPTPPKTPPKTPPMLSPSRSSDPSFSTDAREFLLPPSDCLQPIVDAPPRASSKSRKASEQSKLKEWQSFTSVHL